jgi:hypothetical protein
VQLHHCLYKMKKENKQSLLLKPEAEVIRDSDEIRIKLKCQDWNKSVIIVLLNLDYIDKSTW